MCSGIVFISLFAIALSGKVGPINYVLQFYESGTPTPTGVSVRIAYSVFDK